MRIRGAVDVYSGRECEVGPYGFWWVSRCGGSAAWVDGDTVSDVIRQIYPEFVGILDMHESHITIAYRNERRHRFELPDHDFRGFQARAEFRKAGPWDLADGSVGMLMLAAGETTWDHPLRHAERALTKLGWTPRIGEGGGWAHVMLHLAAPFRDLFALSPEDQADRDAHNVRHNQLNAPRSTHDAP